MDHEDVYRLIYAEQWVEVLDVVHHHSGQLAADPLLAQAVETFIAAFFKALEKAETVAALEPALEKLVLLHSGGFYRLPRARFEQVVAHLVTLHADRPEVALSYARFFPENPRCADVIRQYGLPVPERVAHTGDAAIRLTATAPVEAVDATIGLFKSQQEVDFFMAVREVFPTYFVYPNVALSSLVDFEQIQGQLSGKMKSYFFRGLVDCVVFDQHQGYRPRFFFELDSALHDDEARQERDRYKERILALAGQRLYRIRKPQRNAGRVAFVALLKDIVEQARA